MLKNFRCFNIKYDTDGRNVKLPDPMDIPVDDPEFNPALELADKISDVTGFCVEAFQFKEIFKMTTSPELITLELPDKPSDLLEVAINDLEKIMKDPRYEVDMGGWHWPNTSGTDKCHVCMAGAIMACRGMTPTDNVDPASYDDKTANKLRAIDRMRTGDYCSAFEYLGLSRMIGQYIAMDEDIDDANGDAPSVYDEPEKYIAFFRDVIKTFRAKGY